MHEAKEWVNAVYKSKKKETSGIYIYVDFETLKKSLGETDIPIGSPLKIKRYPLKGAKNLAQIVIKMRKGKI